MRTPENQNHWSLTLAARNAAPRYRAATVRESVPFDRVFNGVTMGLRPTKIDEDAEWFNSWQAETPCPTFVAQGGAGVSARQLWEKGPRLQRSVKRIPTLYDNSTNRRSKNPRSTRLVANASALR
jgi:hypothetical protein